MAAGSQPHVVVIGAGFAGLQAADRLAKKGVRVTIVDRRNHHLFQPLLYQVATAALAAPDIAAPIRKLFRKRKNVRVLLDEVVAIDVSLKRVSLKRSPPLSYDYLLVATGVRTSYFGNDEWARHAPGLKTLEDAFEIRKRVLGAFEEAERHPDDEELRERLLTFVIVGAGPTGVELAGAISEIAQRTLACDFRTFDPKDTRVLLIEAADQVLPSYSEELGASARAQLEKLGVEVKLGAPVEDIDAGGVTLADERIDAGTVLWGAGVSASPLAAALGGETDKAGKVKVDPELTVGGRTDVFAAGDLCTLEQDGEPLPGLAPVAIQMGRHVADNMLRAIRGVPLTPFHYVDKGSLATIGRSKAVGNVFGIAVTGFVAWAGWLFVHLLYLVGFRNRLAVLFDWAWSYLFWQRTARVIAEEPQRDLYAPPVDEDQYDEVQHDEDQHDGDPAAAQEPAETKQATL